MDKESFVQYLKRTGIESQNFSSIGEYWEAVKHAEGDWESIQGFGPRVYLKHNTPSVNKENKYSS